MNDADSHTLTLFAALLEAGPPEAQAAYLDRVCGDDPALRARLERLLQAHQDAGRFLGGEAPASDPAVTIDAPASTEGAGTVIGPYKLLQQIGEGGMGAVYMAEQSQPVRRLVALKIIKSGLVSQHVIARFEAERQALALMDHPNIAKVLDAGTTASGRPYFVMELVKGVPITKFCDERRLTPKQRLELFLPVCQAVQHAHQKGVIHRDLKPSNVLIALYDDKPAPKVIDFGIAKATGQKLTDRTMFTEFGQVVGTLEYMSPEQAGLNQLDIDTRSDIYSLGVLLYELLTGTTPLEKKRLRDGAMLEMLRLIREEEPPRPSTRLSATDQPPSLAANRGLEPKKLSGVVRGDLDWIVMKALDKDRNRRYETASGFAVDLQRHLDDEPVQACPPSAAYRLRKFARRNRAGLTAAGLVALALAAGTAVSAWQAVRATRALDAERTARDALDAARGEQDRQRTAVNGELGTALADVAGLREKAKNARLGDEGPWNQLREALRRAEALAGGELADPALVAQLRALQTGLKQEDADRRMAARLEEIRLDVSALKPGYDRVTARDRFPRCEAAFRDYGIPLFDLDAEEAARRISASAIRDELIAALEEGAYTGGTMYDDGTLWDRLLPILRRVQNDPWHRKYYDAVAAHDGPALVRLARQPETLGQPPAALVVLAWRLTDTEAPGAAVDLLRQVQPRYPADVWINMALMSFVPYEDPKANSLQEVRRVREEGLGYFRAAVAANPQSHVLRQFLGFYLLESWRDSNSPRHDLDEAFGIFENEVSVHPEDSAAHRGLGVALWEKGDREAAVAALRRAAELDPKDTGNYQQLIYYLGQKGDRDGQIAECRKAIEGDPENAVGNYHNVAVFLEAKGDLDGALDACRKAVESARVEEQAVLYETYGRLLREKGDLEGASAAFGKAVDLLRPPAGKDTASLCLTYGEWAETLRQKGDFDGAIANFRKAIELDPKTFSDYGALGAALLHDKDAPVKDVAAAARKAVEAYPQMPWAHYRFGWALQEKGDLDGAIAAYSKAIELNPMSNWWDNRAAAYEARGQWDKAAADYAMASEREPTYCESWRNAAVAYRHLGQRDKALICFTRAIELNPNTYPEALCGRAEIYGQLALWNLAAADYSTAIAQYSKDVGVQPQYAQAWYNRGAVYLDGTGQPDKAVADFSRAIELDPNFAAAWNDRANAYLMLGRPDRAVADCSRAVALNPDYPEAHCTLGLALMRQGAFQAALPELRRGHELGSKNPRWAHPSAQWVRRCERLIELDGRLSGFLEGKTTPASADERIELAELCALKRMHRAANRFYEEAFAGGPEAAAKLLAAHRYNAACEAALAGCDRGDDATRPDERARLRSLAFVWLRDELTRWTTQMEHNPAGMEHRFERWQDDPDLAVVREADSLAELPPAEQQQWRRFWTDVAAQVKRADAAQPSIAKP